MKKESLATTVLYDLSIKQRERKYKTKGPNSKSLSHTLNLRN